MKCNICTWIGDKFNDGHCPSCLSSPRDRIIVKYIKDKYEFSNKRMLKVAPFSDDIIELNVEDFEVNSIWHKEDEKSFAKDIMDLHHLNFVSNAFDLVYCGGVLEYMQSDITCLCEMMRVCRNDGEVVISIDDSFINKGQTKIVEHPKSTDKRRSYGLDFVKRLEYIGYTVSIYEIADDEIEEYEEIGMKGELLFICKINA